MLWLMVRSKNSCAFYKFDSYYSCNFFWLELIFQAIKHGNCEQEAWWPNRLHCVITLTKLSTYYVKGRSVKEPNVECHLMAPISCTRENQHLIRRHILDFRHDLGPIGPFEDSWAPKGNTQSTAHLGRKGFHVFRLMTIRPVVSKVS